MSITLVGSQTSPFVRVVRTVLEELELTHQLEETSFFVTAGAAQDELIKKSNPLMKVPALIDQDDIILDSRIIICYLLEKYASKNSGLEKTLSLDAENQLTVILGIIDAGVLRFIMQNMHPDLDMNSGYMARSHERMLSGLEWLNRQSQLGKNFNIPEMALICGLEWFTRRDICPWDHCSHIVDVYQTHKERQSLVKTRIP